VGQGNERGRGRIHHEAEKGEKTELFLKIKKVEIPTWRDSDNPKRIQATSKPD